MPIEPMHTHYDNLKVSRKAPIEVIRASYKALAQKYHPDLNSGNGEALRIMTLLNLSYEVLSDPIKRASHDAWIAQSELPPVQNVQSATTNPVASAPVYTSSQNSSEITVAASPFGGFLRHLKRYWIFYLALSIWIWYINIGIKLNDSSEMNAAASQQKSNAKKPVYVKPLGSPLGYLWPKTASYVYGYEILAMPGLSTVTIDNTANDNDVFAKLMALDTGAPLPARHFFIPAKRQFTLDNLMPGNYDVRYKDLDSGQLTRSEIFTLQETTNYEGTTFSTMRMTLYKVRNGNMQTYGISESEFGE
jgi:DnaJ domain